MASKIQATITSNTTYYQIYFYYQITPQSYSSGYGKSKVEFDFIVEELADRRFKTNAFSGKSLSVNGTSYAFSTTKVDGYALNTDDGSNKCQYSFFTNSKVNTSSSSYTFPKSFTITHTQAGAGSAFNVSLSAVNAPCDGYGPGKVSISATVPASAFTTLPQKYTITYNKGSYGTGTNFTAQKLYGSSKTLSGAAFIRSGYTQTGWSTSSSGGTKSYDLNASYTSNSNITLYPYWTTTSTTLKIQYDFYNSTGITQNPAAGYGLSTEGYNRIHKNGSEFSVSISKSGSHKIIHPYEFGIEKPGYVFNNTTGYGSQVTKPVIAGNTYAASALSSGSQVWLSASNSAWEEGYKITINPNGGSMQYDKWGSIDSNTHSYSFIKTDWLPISLSNTTVGYYSGYDQQGYFGRGTYIPGLPTRSGRIFKGWSLSSGNTPTIYSLNNHGDNVNVYIAYKDHQDITATAIWDYPLSVNQGWDITISTANAGVYFTTDVIPTTKTYYFNSTGTLDTQIKVYNENGTSLIDDDDDAGEGNNFKLSLTLEAGKRYRVFVRLYSSATGTFSFYFGEGFTLSYNSNGVTSTMPASETMEYGLDHAISSATPTSTSRVFSHWNTEPDGTGVSADPGDIILRPGSNITLYAIWESNYTITFEKNTTDSVSNMPGTYNSSTGKYTATKVHGTDYWIPSKVPTRTGYTFVGWGSSPTAMTWTNGPAGMANPFTGGTYEGKYTQDADFTYYAIWSLKPNTNYTTSALSAGGYQEYLFLPSATKNYSIFTRAGTASNKLDPELYLYNSSGTLLNSNDDDLSNELDSSEDNNWNALIRTSLTARTMYKIRVTWRNTSYSGAIPFTLATSHTINLDPQDGSVTTSSLTGWFGREYSDCGLSYDMFSYPGYFVTALSTNKDDPASAEITPSTTRINTSSNHTVYACWAPESFTITLNNQSATSAGTASVELLYSKYWYSSTTSEQITKITKPTKTGYYFGGYYTGTSGTGTQIIDDKGNMVSNKLTFTTTDTTLYAKWTAKKLTVKYHKNNPDGTTESTATQIFTYNSVGTRRFGYVDNSNTKKWTSPNDYATAYGFGEWYFPGYKIIGWGDNSAAVAYTENAPYNNVSNDWINKNVGDAATGTKDIYAIWDYNGVVRIYYDGEWKYAIPYIYNGSSWQYGVPYIYKNSTDGWKMST